MQADPFQANRELERELCAYTGAPYAVAVNSCTMAILLACAWMRHTCGRASMVFLPKLTYVGVPMSVLHSGHGVTFEDVDWQGEYELRAVPDWRGRVFDAARRFTAGMFSNIQPLEMPNGQQLADFNFQCVSFHVSKILGHSQGGAILHNDKHADAWLRRARFDGRTEGVPAAEDRFDMIGWHAYMSPDVAAALRWKLASLPRHNADLPRDNYPDLSLHPAFQMGKTPA